MVSWPRATRFHYIFVSSTNLAGFKMEAEATVYWEGKNLV
jgi:hypothetical protein